MRRYAERREIKIRQRYILIKSASAGGYGIRVESSSGETATYRCISFRRKDVEELLRRLADSEIAFVHVGDIVRDYLTELYYGQLAANGFGFDS